MGVLCPLLHENSPKIGHLTSRPDASDIEVAIGEKRNYDFVSEATNQVNLYSSTGLIYYYLNGHGVEVFSAAQSWGNCTQSHIYAYCTLIIRFRVFSFKLGTSLVLCRLVMMLVSIL